MGCGESKHAIATENTLTKSKSKAKSVETNNTPLENATIDDDANVKENHVQETGDKTVKKDEIPIHKEERKVEPLPEKTKESENIAENGNENIKKIDENDDGKMEAVAVVDESENVGIDGEKKDNREVDQEEKRDNSEVDQEENEKMISNDCPKNDDAAALVANSENEKEEDIKVDEGKEVVVADAADESKSSVEEKVPAAKDENVNAESSTTEVKAN